jgi:hypothetical protein
MARPTVFDDVNLLQNLGEADADATISCASYLIFLKGSPINFRELGGLPLTARYTFDQLANPDSVLFTPGGFYDRTTMLAGMAGTASSTAISQKIMRLMKSSIKKRFSKHAAFWLGPEAKEALDQNMRLTTNIRSPREYDLKAEPNTSGLDS